MKSLPRLFAALVFPLFVLCALVGCSGASAPPPKTLKSIAVAPATPASLKVGATQQFTATGTFSDNSTADISATVTWTSATPATATISTAGLATAVAQGTTQITASMTGITSTGVTLTVISLTSIAVTPNPASVAVGNTKQFTATGTYSDASTADITTQVTWSSATTAVATITASGGLATGVKTGTSQITATSGTVVSPAVTLTVTPAVAVSVKIVQVNPTIAIGSVEDFTALFVLSDGTTVAPTAAVTWSSGTTATASIIANSGIASGLAAGTSTITAASTGLTSGTTTLTVVAAVPRFAYTISPSDGVVSAFAVNSTASALAPISSVSVPETPLQLVFEPSGQFAYAPGALGHISIYTVDSVGGALSPSGLPNAAITSFVSGTSSITQSAVDPSGRYLYVLDSGTSRINAYSIATSTTSTTQKGTLAPIGLTPTATGPGPAGLVIHPTGKFLYVTNNNGVSTLSAFSIGSNGALTAIVLNPAIFATAGLNSPEIPSIDPTGQFLFVPNIGASPGSVSAFIINTTDGTLAAVGAATTSASLKGAFGTAIDPAGKFLFVTSSGGGNVVVFPIGGGGVLGAATSYNSGTNATSGPATVAIDPTGSFAATANNLENSITLFSLATGVLTPKFTAETRLIPEFVSIYSGTSAPVIGPSNVFAANSGSGNISGFTAVNTTGVLSAGTGSPTAGIAGNKFLTADSTGTSLFNSSPSGKAFGGFSVTPSTAALAAFTGAPFHLITTTDAPSEIATEPSSRFIFVADTTGNVVNAFSLANPPASLGGTSSLTSVNTVVADPQGDLLYALGNNVINPIWVSGFNGTITPSGTALSQTGTWTSGAIDPSGHWLVALDSTGKTLQSFKITPIQIIFGSPDGNLTAVGTPLATAVTTPSSVTFDPQGRFVFVSDATNGTVTPFAFNESTGVVTAITGKQTTVSATGTGRVSIDSSGTYLYAAVTGNGGTVPSGVAAYKINADGSLTAVGGSPFAAGAGTTGTSGVVVTSSVK